MTVQIRILACLALLSALAGLAGCDRGDGFASPSDKRTLRPLGDFTGKAVHAGDTAASSRLINLNHPRVAVLWRSVGMRDMVASDGQVSINATAPFAFNLKLLQPPPKGVLESPDMMFGIVSLYCDANGNDAFDRIMHPDYFADYDHIDSLAAKVRAAQQDLMNHSVVLAPRLVEERFFLDADGSIRRALGAGLDSVMNVKQLPGLSPDTLLKGWVGNCSRILGRQNRFERFFAQRKKDNEFFFEEIPASGHYKGLRGRFERSLFPRPGQEAEFDSALKRTVLATLSYHFEGHQVIARADSAGRLEYPFNGYGQAGTDWMAGRSVTDLLLYVGSEAARDSLLDAVPQSSFRVSNLERFRIGYNLFRCDEQYVCEVRAAGDSIMVYLGTSELFFNRPSLPSKAPFPAPGGSTAQPVSAPSAEALARLQGAYALNGSDTVRVVLRHGELWSESPEAGLVRVAPVDSFGFASPALDFQGLLTPGFTGRPDRMMLYCRGGRTVYGRVGGLVSGGSDAALLERIDRASGFSRADLADSAMEDFAGVYDFGGDTLRIARAGGDSLKVGLPKFRSLVFHAAGDSLFRCPWGEWTLEFQGLGDGNAKRVVFGKGAVKIVVPRFGVSPSKSLKSDKAELTEWAGIAWMAEHSGTAQDAFTGLNGKKRYGCSGDGAFLRPGDGFLEGYSRGYASDSISLRAGGDEATFRITGMQGKLALFQLRNCAERGVKSGRIRVSVWSGSEPDALRPSYGDHTWMDSDTSGVYWSLDSLSVQSDPFYLVLRQENTQDPKFHNAFDGYRIGVRP